jgi:type IV pilus assembly protein PilM
MMIRTATLPLGIDIGRRRVRVALTEHDGDGSRLISVAARDHDGDPEGALAQALHELGTNERRCVVALGLPDAMLRTIEFPPMPQWERVRAARYEAARFIAYPLSEATVSLAPGSGDGRWTLGVARRDAVHTVRALVRRQQLKLVALDDGAHALQRVHPTAGCIVDIGSIATRVIVAGDGVPAVTLVPIGGDTLTHAIADALGIDTATAERRKRHTGFGGAGESERDRLVAGVTNALQDARFRHALPLDSIILCGNGARVPEIESALCNATGARVSIAALPPECSARLPADVLRSSGADWSAAYGLSLWSCAS